MKTILFTGDSLTDGNRYKKPEQAWDLNHQIGHSFVYVINAMLGSRYPERDYHFVNRGISGNRIIDLYARVETDLLDLHPDVVSILVGVNDGPSVWKNGRFTCAEKYARLYRMMLDEVRRELPDVKLILCEPFVCRVGKLTEKYDAWYSCMQAYSKELRGIAKEYQAVFVPLQDTFDEACRKKEASYWCWDGIHPTENGHGLIARQWLRYAGPVLDNEETVF